MFSKDFEDSFAIDYPPVILRYNIRNTGRIYENATVILYLIQTFHSSISLRILSVTSEMCILRRPPAIDALVAATRHYENGHHSNSDYMLTVLPVKDVKHATQQ